MARNVADDGFDLEGILRTACKSSGIQRRRKSSTFGRRKSGTFGRRKSSTLGRTNNVDGERVHGLPTPTLSAYRRASLAATWRYVCKVNNR